MHLTQRQSVIGLLGCGTAIVMIVLFIRIITGSPLADIVVTVFALLAFGGLLLAYWRGWEPARYVLVIVLTALVIFSPYDRDEGVQVGALVAPIIALVVASPIWVVGSGVAIYLGVFMQGIPSYRDPVNMLAYALSLCGLVVSRLVVEAVAHAAEENARRASENERRAEEEKQLSMRRAEELTIQNDQQRRLLELVAELEIPAIALADNVLFAPIVGHMDSRRAEALIARLLEAASLQRARMLILDITGVTTMDTHVAQALMRATQALRLLGCQVSITGISPMVAATLTTLGITFTGASTARTPQEALAQYAVA